MKLLKNLSLAIIISGNTLAQNETDVLRYTETDFFGTARTTAMAGSFGALGADFSAVNINPAGIARFSSSDFSLAFDYGSINATGVYNGTSLEDSRNNFKLSNLGFVFTTDLSESNRGVAFRHFYIGYTRLSNYDLRKSYEGQNFNSLLDVFANDGEGVQLDNDDIFFERPFSTGLGLDIDAIGYDPNAVSYFPLLTPGDMYHQRTIEQSGGMGEFHIGLSENFAHQVYYGASIGIRRAKYNEKISHNEVLMEPNAGITSLESFDYLYDLEARGWGLNLKGGILFLPDDMYRIGFSFETPTVLNMNEEFGADMIGYHNYGTVTIPNEWKPRGEFEYRVRTPLKLRASAAYIFDYKGALNIDAEFLHYGNGELRSTNTNQFGVFNFNAQNSAVEQLYRPVVNLRIGFEHLITQNIFFRAGYAMQPQPFKREFADVTKPFHTLGIGLGYFNRKVAIDVGYRLRSTHESYFAFDPSDPSNRTAFENNFNHFVVSMAIKW